MEVKIDGKNKYVTFALNKKFYPLEDILKSAQAFSEICWVNIDENEGKLNVTLTPKSDMELENLKNEFCNYVLGVIKTKRSDLI
jgi:hypothetical protein